MSPEMRRRRLDGIAYVRDHFPGLIEDLFATTREKRMLFKKHEWEKPKGEIFRDIPILTFETEFWRPHFQLLGQKLLLALHYQCFKQPLSENGEVWLQFRMNTDAEPLASIYDNLVGNLAIPISQGSRIGDQFSLRWGVAENAKVAAWSLHLHHRLYYFGVTIDDPVWLTNSGSYMFGERLKRLTT